MTYFFEEITQMEIIPQIIIESTPDQDEQDQLLEIAKSTIHHEVMDLIFRELDVVQQHEFLAYIEMSDSHLSTIEKLKEWITDIEQKILLKVRQAEQEIVDEIQRQN